MADIRKRSENPARLMADVRGDERNVILTLARIWLTAATGEISSKDLAAEWVMPRLPGKYADLLDKARRAYLGEYADKWEGMEPEVDELVAYMKKSIESLLEN